MLKWQVVIDGEKDIVLMLGQCESDLHNLQFVALTDSEISYDINCICSKVIFNMVLMFYSESSSVIFMRLLIKFVTVYNMHQKKMNSFGFMAQLLKSPFVSTRVLSRILVTSFFYLHLPVVNIVDEFEL